MRIWRLPAVKTYEKHRISNCFAMLHQSHPERILSGFGVPRGHQNGAKGDQDAPKGGPGTLNQSPKMPKVI